MSAGSDRVAPVTRSVSRSPVVVETSSELPDSFTSVVVVGSSASVRALGPRIVSNVFAALEKA